MCIEMVSLAKDLSSNVKVWILAVNAFSRLWTSVVEFLR